MFKTSRKKNQKCCVGRLCGETKGGEGSGLGDGPILSEKGGCALGERKVGVCWEINFSKKKGGLLRERGKVSADE